LQHGFPAPICRRRLQASLQRELGKTVNVDEKKR
jgi:hypothetical protein